MEQYAGHSFVGPSSSEFASILVIDREISGRSSLLNVFAPFDCEIVTCATVHAFLRRRGGKHYDLVVMEVDVFDPDALQNTLILRAYFDLRVVPQIVGIATFAPGEFLAFAEQAGCDECMLIGDLPKALRRLLADYQKEVVPIQIH